MSTGIIETIKKVALNAFEASNPVKLLFGKVISVNPIKVQVGELLTLTKEFLVVNGSVEKGDKVTLIRCQGGQKYVVLGSRTEYVEKTIQVGGETGSEGSAVASGKWQLPFKSGYIKTSDFGYRRPPTAGASSYHAGVDIVGTGSKHIYAVNSGTVLTAGWNGGYGNAVLISHGNSIYSFYAHMSTIYVKPNQKVSKKTIVGVEGSTGISTGSHLHFEIRKSRDGSQVDPLAFLNSN